MASDVPVISLVKSIDFAAVKHKNQRRKDPEKTPYINHPIGVARYLIDCNVTDPVILQAAILHDTVEDTDTTFEEIEETFGPKVCSIVREVTDDKSLPKEVRKALQIEHALNSSPEAKLVKLADKLYNLTDLLRVPPTNWSEQRIEEYFIWSAKVVKNLRGTNAELEAKLDDVFKRSGLVYPNTVEK